MKGTILDFSIQTSEGIISGDDNNRYRFAGSEWKASDPPTRGQRVDFDQDNGRAVQVYLELPKAIATARVEPKSNVEISQVAANKPTSPNTTAEKLLLDRVAKRSTTRDRMVTNQKVRTVVCAIIAGLGLLSLLGTLAGGKEGVHLAGSDHTAEMVADVTGLTEHLYVSDIGLALGLIAFGGLLFWRWKPLWEGWPFMRAKAWFGGVFFFIGFLTLITELCRGDEGGITGGIIFGGIGIWLFKSGIAKTKAIIAHLSVQIPPAV